MTHRIPLDHLTSDQLDQLYNERDRFKAAILDIDAHATPIGLANPNDPDGNPHHYAVTVGALHRALGKVGHTAAPCTAEAAIARVHQLVDECEANGHSSGHPLTVTRIRTALTSPEPTP